MKESITNNADNPILSIILATYNCADALDITLESIKRLRGFPYELIVIDGNSGDGTLSCLARWDYLVAYQVSEPDDGIYDAWNKGVKIARGEWLCFIGAGDRLIPEAFITYKVHIDRYKSRVGSLPDYVSSRGLVVNGAGNGVALIGLPWSWPKFKRKMTCCHVGSWHNKSIFKSYGIFDSSYQIAGDYELLLRAGSSLKAEFFGDLTVCLSEGGVSTRSIPAIREMIRAKHETGKLASSLCIFDGFQDIFKIAVNRVIRFFRLSYRLSREWSND